MMNVYVCTDHKGHWPVGVASVIVAETEGQARELLQEALKADGLLDKPFTLQLLDLTVAKAHVLNDGAY